MNYLSLDYYLQRARSSVRTSKSIGRFLVSGASRHESYLKINAHSEPGYNSPSMRVCKSYHGTSRGLAKVRTFGFLRVFETFLNSLERRSPTGHSGAPHHFQPRRSELHLTRLSPRVFERWNGIHLMVLYLLCSTHKTG